MLEDNEILYNIISLTLKEFKRKVIRIYVGVNMSVLQSFDMAYKRRRKTKKGKRSNKNSPPFTVSLKSLKLKGTSVNSQVQKRLESSLNKRGKFGKVNNILIDSGGMFKVLGRRVTSCACKLYSCTHIVSVLPIAQLVERQTSSEGRRFKPGLADVKPR